MASLQYAVGALQMPGAGYALGTVVKNPLVLLKTRAALEAQAAAVLAYYEGFCAAGWPAQLEALCPRSTAASQALGKGPVPIAFHGCVCVCGGGSYLLARGKQSSGASQSLPAVHEAGGVVHFDMMGTATAQGGRSPLSPTISHQGIGGQGYPSSHTDVFGPPISRLPPRGGSRGWSCKLRSGCSIGSCHVSIDSVVQ